VRAGQDFNALFSQQLNRALAGRWRVGDQRVQQRQRADVVCGAGDKDGHQAVLAAAQRSAQARANLVVSERLGLEVLLHQRIVGLGGGFDQRQPCLFDSIGHVGGRGGDLLARAQVRLLRQQVHHAGELSLRADGQHHRHEAVVREALAHHAQHVGEVGVLTIHFVDDDGNWKPEFLRIIERQLGAHLWAGHGVHHDDRCIGHAHGVLCLAHEVHIAGRVQDVDLVPAVLDGQQRAVNGQAARLLILIEVGDGVPLFDLFQTSGRAGGEQQALGQAGLAGALVAYQSDIPQQVSGIVFHADQAS